MCSTAPGTPSTTPAVMMASRYSVDQSASVAGVTRGSAASAAASPRTAQPASSSAFTSAGKYVLGGIPVDESVSAEPHTPVRRSLALTAMRLAISRFGGLVDIDVADALQMREHRHARFLLHTLDEALAPARHDDVDRAIEASEHQANGLAIGDGHDLDARFGKTGGLEAGDERAMDRECRLQALGAGAQDRRIAGLEAEPARVRRHVRAALEDDADDAERGRDALDGQARSAVSTTRARGRPDRGARRCRRSASAMPASRSSLSVRRSMKAAGLPGGLGGWQCRRHWPRGSMPSGGAISSAAEVSARFFSAVVASASRRWAARAARPMARRLEARSGALAAAVVTGWAPVASG